MLIEDQGFAIRNLASREVAANKLCVPNQIELGRRATLPEVALRKLGFRFERPLSRRKIEDYLALENCRVLGIVRDGNAVISSIMKRGRQSFRIASGRWCRAIEILLELKRRFPERTLVLTYESLVKDPEQHMRRVCAFIGLDFAEQMMGGYRFNPLYPGEKSIDENRAERHRRENINFELEGRFPRAYRLYKELC